MPQPKVADRTRLIGGERSCHAANATIARKKHDVVIVGALPSCPLVWRGTGDACRASDATNPGDGASHQPQGGVPKVRVVDHDGEAR